MERGMVMMRLPIGFRFRPTDEELVVYYLRRKALSLPLPAPVIHNNFNVFLSHPSSFPGDLMEKRRYYFCRGSTGNISLTATGCGFWKANTKVKQIVATSGVVVGTKKLWAFYQKSGPRPNGWTRTLWAMHHFQLPQSTQNQLGGEKQEWGVCMLFQRKRRPNIPLNNFNGIGGGYELPTYIDFTLEVNNSCDSGPPQASSSTTESSTSTGSGEESVQEEQLTSQASFSSN